MKKDHDSVTILGVGITSIMTAVKLSEAGYKISLYTRGPDPRLDRNAEQHGATGNGRSARFITGLEGKPHLFDGSIASNAVDEIHTPFVEGGWLSKNIKEYSRNDQMWLKERVQAAKDSKHIADLYNNYYAKNNRESIADWVALGQTMPFLFENADVTDAAQGVLVLCNTDALLQATAKTYKKHAFLKQTLTKEEVAERFPVFKHACQEGHVAGGLVVDGFSFNVHQFIENAINYLETKGVLFFWNEEVTEVKLDASGNVMGLQTQHHGLVRSDHYSINPGAYGNRLLEATPAKGKIAGVAGRWIITPRPHDFTLPTKILSDNRFGASIGDNNLTPFTENGQPMLAISGGSIFVGSDYLEILTPEACKVVDDENERIVQLYLAPHYSLVKEKNEIKPWTNTCLRSFTCDDRPIHEVMRTPQGGFLTITAGTNTGTTALAPYLANWTLQTITGKNNIQ